MKKILFTLAAVVVVASAVVLSSCKSEDKSVRTSAQATWGYETTGYSTGAAKCDSLLKLLNARSAEVIGTSMMLDSDDNGVILESAATSLYNTAKSDSKIQDLTKQMLALKVVNPTGDEYYLKSVILQVGNSQKRYEFAISR